MISTATDSRSIYIYSVDPCIQCTKRSVFVRSVFECGASQLFFDFFSDYPLDAVASERAFSSNFRRQQASERSFSIIFRRLEASKRAFSSTFRREEASEPAFFEQFSMSGGFGAIIFDDFSTSGGSAARIFEDVRGRPRAESPRRQASLDYFCIDDSQKHGF